MAISIHVRPGKKVEGMAAAKSHDGSQREPGHKRVFPWTINNRGSDNLVPLIKVGEPTFGRQVGIVLRSKITVEVSRSVKRFAVSVVADEREVVAEALLEFDDSPLVKRGRF